MTKRKTIRLISTALAVIILALLGIGVTQEGELTAPNIEKPIRPGFYQVVSVSDGDTIQVKIAGKDETVRLIGIDTPETRDPRKAVQCFGKVASDKAHQLMDGKQVRLEADPGGDDRDKYKRLLRFVYLEDGTLVNELMVREGYAFAYTIFPNSKLEDFRAWEREARSANRGLWAGCQIKETNDKRETNDASG